MEKSNKAVIIINGRSGVGKDTLIEFAEAEFRVQNVSSIDRVKQIAQEAGWDGVKDARGRKLLIDIKQALVDYDDLPMKFMLEEVEKFFASNNQILFIHIREPHEILKLKNAINSSILLPSLEGAAPTGAGVVCDGVVKTLLITRDLGDNFYRHANDTGVLDFEYDLVFENEKPIDESGKAFVSLLKTIIS